MFVLTGTIGVPVEVVFLQTLSLLGDGPWPQ